MLRDLGIVAPRLRDEPLRALAVDEHLDGIAERKSGESASSTTA